VNKRARECTHEKADYLLGEMIKWCSTCGSIGSTSYDPDHGEESQIKWQYPSYSFRKEKTKRKFCLNDHRLNRYGYCEKCHRYCPPESWAIRAAAITAPDQGWNISEHDTERAAQKIASELQAQNPNWLITVVHNPSLQVELI